MIGLSLGGATLHPTSTPTINTMAIANTLFRIGSLPATFGSLRHNMRIADRWVDPGAHVLVP
jgi:hypothetical protein